MANINGTNGADTINGTALDDVINARKGNDTVFAGDGNDVVDGGEGNDTLWGGLGNDWLIGGLGADILIGGEGDDTLDGGGGTDIASFEGGAAVIADLTTGVATGQGTDTLIGIERLRGSSFGDSLRGSAGANTLEGGAGNDLLIATAGADTLNGGADNDTVSFANLTAAVIATVNGAYNAGAAGTGSMSNVENLIGTGFNDTLTGNNGANVINGGIGNDVMNGGGGIDTVSYEGVQTHNFINLAAGTASQQWNAQFIGNDTLTNFENVIGGANRDTVWGNAGNNVISTGDSVDTVYASLGVDTLDGGAGVFDSVDFTDVAAVTASLATGSYAIDANNFGTMTNMEHLTGGAGGDTLTGDAGVNYLSGGAGGDTLAGGQGNDELWGGAGSDRLIADGGNDLLDGNWDRLGATHDLASDTFEIRTNAGVVTIQDFELGVDKLDLTAFGFDQNGVSPYWTGAVSQNGNTQVLTLTGLNAEVVTICLVGVAAGEALSLSDMINGSSSLIPSSPYPINGGNGVADQFVIVEGGYLSQSGLSNTVSGFENGLDKIDISYFMNNLSSNNAPWDIQLHTTPAGDVKLHFTDNVSITFDVSFPGFTIAQLDASDYIL